MHTVNSSLRFLAAASIAWAMTPARAEAHEGVLECPFVGSPAPLPAGAQGLPVDPVAGYRVDPLGDGLYTLTDGLYWVMFLVTDQGVMLVDAPPSLAGEEVSNPYAQASDEAEVIDPSMTTAEETPVDDGTPTQIVNPYATVSDEAIVIDPAMALSNTESPVEEAEHEVFERSDPTVAMPEPESAFDEFGQPIEPAVLVAALQVPMLIIHAADDRETPATHVALMRASLAFSSDRARFEMVEGADHDFLESARTAENPPSARRSATGCGCHRR